jgi:hypothetical protein
MNAITVLLVAAAVHLAGVDIDSAATARLTVFSDGVPAYEWDLDGRTGGVYRFVSTGSARASAAASPAPAAASPAFAADAPGFAATPTPDGELLVVRLPEPEMVYTLVHGGVGEADPPHGLGTVSLAGWRAELSAIVRAGGVPAAQPLDAERVLSTWVATNRDGTSDAASEGAASDAESDSAASDSAASDSAASASAASASDGPASTGTSVVTGRVILSHSTTSWTFSHPDSRQIVTLTTIP